MWTNPSDESRVKLQAIKPKSDTKDGRRWGMDPRPRSIRAYRNTEGESGEEMEDSGKNLYFLLVGNLTSTLHRGESETEQTPVGVHYVTENVRNEAEIDSSDSQVPEVGQVEDGNGYFNHASLGGTGWRPRL